MKSSGRKTKSSEKSLTKVFYHVEKRIISGLKDKTEEVGNSMKKKRVKPLKINNYFKFKKKKTLWNRISRKSGTLQNN